MIEPLRLRKYSPEANPGIRAVIFRVPEKLKVDFQVAVLKNRISVQKTLVAFLQIFVDHDRGVKTPDVIKTVIEKAKNHETTISQ